ncbi:MAG: hypothetical protein EBT39_05390 [Sphingobacteriia bacterium]|nr:hypothetical protein [Candidatus Fonsibacter lacus]
MIQFEKNYDINNGNGSVTFKKVDEQTVEAVYNRGTINAKWDDGILKGIYSDTVSNGSGLIHFTFSENAFEAKWKSGTEEGPMKGKWVGKLLESGKTNEIDNSLAAPNDKITVTVIVDKFNYRAKRSLETTAEELDIVGMSYTSEDYDTKIKWSSIETIDDYRYSLDEKFYDHMYDSGFEIKSGNEFGDWYELDVKVENENGELIYSGIHRG